jgi:archaeoflavoprotein AfpA
MRKDLEASKKPLNDSQFSLNDTERKQMSNPVKVKKRKIAWGISGGGDKIAEVVQTMKELKTKYAEVLEIEVFASKAGETMLKYYNLEKTIKETFPKYMVEVNSNTPFLAAMVQSQRYGIFLIAPASSNTVAKIVNGIGDTLLTNTAIMGLKAFVPLYVMPTDYRENIIYTKLPNGKEMKLRVRKEEAEQTRKLEATEDAHVFEDPQKLRQALEDWIQNPP